MSPPHVVVAGNRQRDQPPARAEDPFDFCHETLWLLDVLEHPARSHDVEVPGRKRNRACGIQQSKPLGMTQVRMGLKIDSPYHAPIAFGVTWRCPGGDA